MDPKRIATLRAEIDNVVHAISGGALRNSPALGRRLRELESELESLEAISPVTTMPVVSDVRERFRRMLDRLPEVLSREPARAREALREVLPPEIMLRPAAAGGYLEAEFGVEVMPLAACAGGASEKKSGSGGTSTDLVSYRVALR